MTDAAHVSASINSLSRWVLLTAAALVVGLGGWAASTQMSGAIIAHGAIVSESYTKKVQHPTGGVVHDLLVSDDQHVKAGDVLIRLDDTQARAALAITESDLMLLDARERRLRQEQAVATGVSGPDLLSPAGQSPEMARQLLAERKLMDARRLLRERQKAQLTEQMVGQQQQIEGLHSMAESRDRQIGLINDELTGVQKLYGEGYAPISALKSLQRQAESLSGERGQIQENAAEANNKVAELRLQSLQIDAQHLAEVMTDLRDVETRRGELIQKVQAQKDELNRVEIRSPQDGFVHELAVHTVGGVVTPGEPLMLIVPANDTLAVETHIDPKDISEVSVGQQATVKFVGLNPRTMPDLEGRVSRISADVVQDQRTGAAYYVARIELPRSEVNKLRDVKLVPGMPVETYIRTSDRTVLSFMIKPMTDLLSHTFRER